MSYAQSSRSTYIQWFRPGPLEGHHILVIAPNLFISTKWCCQKLTNTKIILSKDIPTKAQPLLNESQVKELALNFSYIPGKCCLALLEAFPSIPPVSLGQASGERILPKDVTVKLNKNVCRLWQKQMMQKYSEIKYNAIWFAKRK